MVLSDIKIKKAIENGDIVILPFNIDNLGTNSYDITLSDEVLVYTNDTLDPYDKDSLSYKRLDWKDNRILLKPGELYICSSVEYTESHKHVPIIWGKSSLGRLGLFIHITAGFGDIGFCGKWTLELTCIKPIYVYKGMKIAQIVWFDAYEADIPYHSKKDAKYHKQLNATISKYYENK